MWFHLWNGSIHESVCGTRPQYHHKIGHSNPSFFWGGKVEESGVQGYPLLRSKCEASLGCIQELSPFLGLVY